MIIETYHKIIILFEPKLNEMQSQVDCILI